MDKVFGCCSKIFGCSNKTFICRPLFCCRNKTFFSSCDPLNELRKFSILTRRIKAQNVSKIYQRHKKVSSFVNAVLDTSTDHHFLGSLS